MSTNTLSCIFLMEGSRGCNKYLGEIAMVKKPFWSPQPGSSQSSLALFPAGDAHCAGKALQPQPLAVLPQKPVASSLAEPDSSFIEASISFMLQPCSQTVDFLPVTAKMSVFEGNRGSEENGSSFKNQSSKYGIPFSPAWELFTFKASGKTFRKHNKATKQTHEQNKLCSPQR